MTKADKVYQIIFDAKNPLLASEIAELSGEKKPHNILHYLYNKEEIKRRGSRYGYKYYIDDTERKSMDEYANRRKKVWEAIRKGLVEGLTEPPHVEIYHKPNKEAKQMSMKNTKIAKIIDTLQECLIHSERDALTASQISTLMNESGCNIHPQLFLLYKSGDIQRVIDDKKGPYKYYVDNNRHLKAVPSEIKQETVCMSKEILKEINNSEKPLSAKEIKDRVGKSNTNIWAQLNWLFKNGKIKRHDLADVYKYYSTDFDLQSYMCGDFTVVDDSQTIDVSMEMIVKAYKLVVSENDRLVSKHKEANNWCESFNNENKELISKNNELHSTLSTALSEIEELKVKLSETEESLSLERERSSQFEKMIPTTFNRRELSFFDRVRQKF